MFKASTLQTHFKHASSTLQVSFKHASSTLQARKQAPNTLQASFKHASSTLQAGFKHASSTLQASFKHASSTHQARFKHASSMHQACFKKLQAKSCIKHASSTFLSIKSILFAPKSSQLPEHKVQKHKHLYENFYSITVADDCGQPTGLYSSEPYETNLYDSVNKKSDL